MQNERIEKSNVLIPLQTYWDLELKVTTSNLFKKKQYYPHLINVIFRKTWYLWKTVLQE